MARVHRQLLRSMRVFMGRAFMKWGVGMSLMEKVALLQISAKVEGDYLEFGVFQGASFIESYHALHNAHRLMIRGLGVSTTPEDAKEWQEIWERSRFFAFDSFEGLPELEGIDQDTKDFAKGKFAAGIEEFRGNIAGQGVPLDRVTCIPGWFDQTCVPATIEAHGLRKASVIWIDCDLYHSTKSVLDFVVPLLQDGTILIFDDWYCFRGNPQRGEQRAFAEWRGTLPGYTFSEYQKEGPFRNSFVVSEVLEGRRDGE